MSPVAPTPFAGPYRGLEPFDENAMAFFFGRERESRLITASLFAAQLTLLYGQSGVGKSSVLRAGVLPLLRERKGVLPVVYPRYSNSSGPGSTVERGWQFDAVTGIKETAWQAMQACARDEDERRRFAKEILPFDMAPLGESLEAIARITDRLVMVILDQFEEYSLYHPSDDDLFSEQFPKAIASRSRNVAFLLSLREDALAKLDRFKATIPTLWDSYRRIDHLDHAAGEDAIRKPLSEYNLRLGTGEAPAAIEDDLVQQVLQQVQAGNFQVGETGSGSLGSASTGSVRIETPYLQLVMTRLWEREQEDGSALLRASTLRSEGGAEQIVLTHLDRVMDQFSEPERELAAKLFHRLVTPGGAKIAYGVADLAKYEGVSELAVGPILQRLEEGNRRILRRVADAGDLRTEPRYEIFHDRLGKAMLAWRSKYLAERDLQASARQQAEQKRIAEDSLRQVAGHVAATLDAMSEKRQRTWVACLFFLVNSQGIRLAQTLSQLSAASGENPTAIQQVLNALILAGIVRETQRAKLPQEPLFEVSHDAVARALLEWHSAWLLRQQSAPSVSPTPSGGVTPDALPARAALSAFPYEVVRRLFLDGLVIPYVGSGVSLSGTEGNPASYSLSNRGLKEALARRSDYPATEFASSDVSEVASYFALQSGRSQLDSMLAELLDRPEVAPSPAHMFLAEIARVQPLLILTTNYDRLMETALADLGVRHNVLSYVADAEGLKDRLALFEGGLAFEPRIEKGSNITFESERTLVFRLHGGGGIPRCPYVITEEDHIDWILRLRGRESWLSSGLAYLLSRGHLLSLGHGARDWSQRAFWRTMSDERIRKQAWAVALQPSPLSVMTWQRYDVKIYNEDLTIWSERMREGLTRDEQNEPNSPVKGSVGPAKAKKTKPKPRLR